MMTLRFRRAVVADLPVIVAMLADDDLSNARESGAGDLSAYQAAFASIHANLNQFICVAESKGEVVGTLQLTFISGLSRRGAKRGQIEAVRIARRQRGGGFGKAMLAWAIEKCREQGAFWSS